MSKGKVYLVGAGPGDPGLITKKGAEALSHCDAVVYDRLIPLELVVTLPARVERHYVGKAADRHTMKQENINELLADLAEAGKTVVRLKGGDPFVFARGGEEAQHLRERDIPFEIIPGVTAGIGVAAYAGIPTTHRGRAVFTLFLTAHEAAYKEDLQIPWNWLAKAKNGTITGYMGVKQLDQVVKRLIQGGFDPDTPAAVIERGTLGVQKSVQASLQDLPDAVDREEIKPPALFVIGSVVELADELSWFGEGILAGKRVMVTRPADQARDMYRMLRQHGAEVLPLPTIATEAHDDSNGWQKFQAIDFQQDNLWIVFSSENGVRYFMKQFFQKGYDYRTLGRVQIAAMGSGTDRALRQHHLKADFLPSKYISTALAQEFSQHILGSQATVIRVRGNLGDSTIEDAIAKVDSNVTILQVYNTFTAHWDAGMWACLEENTPDIITFTSGSTATSLVEILGEKRAKDLAQEAQVVTIGPMTTRTAKEAGLTVDLEAETHSVPGLIEKIVQYHTK